MKETIRLKLISPFCVFFFPNVASENFKIVCVVHIFLLVSSGLETLFLT